MLKQNKQLATIKTLIIIIALTYNSWITTTFLNPNIDSSRAYISEYASQQAKNSYFYRLADIITSIMIYAILYCFWKNKNMWKNIENKIGKIVKKTLFTASIIFSTLTFIDALFPMTCIVYNLSEKQINSPKCATWSTMTHEISSVLIGATAIVMITTYAIWNYSIIRERNLGITREKNNNTYCLKYSKIINFSAILHLLSIIYLGVSCVYLKYLYLGYAQRISVLSLSIWAIFTVLEFTKLAFDTKNCKKRKNENAKQPEKK